MMNLTSEQLRQALRLYLVMGSSNCAEADPYAVLEGAIAGGITMFQFREKGANALQGQAKLELGARLRRLCAQHAVPFIVNDDERLALELEADGIHIGQEDAPAAEIRRRLKGMIVGVSAHDLGEAESALAAGADYLGVGPQYATRTKHDAREVQGPAVLERMRVGGIQLPIVGIGGIDADKARAVIRAGADGVAVVSAISQARSPREAADQLLSIISNSLGGIINDNDIKG
ncbi:thiamine phosphate synthase [Paenibacillus sp. SYP-B3998]|uniref:Thiamine-phosphate synthase n=1 Tax=Paenibacillus sp. SYP-B3998 TaxID=2678564 RepID=A0A6G3ZXH1_9BACL|nr:thiamine phosphate synthase [Paenibacillus sp. SYP-B3998]NEW06913.1 thiamine phosphate synthase [Paenibacillus sp. SYP-B3998]